MSAPPPMPVRPTVNPTITPASANQGSRSNPYQPFPTNSMDSVGVRGDAPARGPRSLRQGAAGSTNFTVTLLVAQTRSMPVEHPRGVGLGPLDQVGLGRGIAQRLITELVQRLVVARIDVKTSPTRLTKPRSRERICELSRSRCGAA